jgi:hypothetical protein
MSRKNSENLKPSLHSIVVVKEEPLPVPKIGEDIDINEVKSFMMTEARAKYEELGPLDIPLDGSEPVQCLKLYNGEVFVGSIDHAGQRSGKGLLITNEEYVVEGTFANGEIEGSGRMIFPSGDVYKGDFMQGKMSGKGELLEKSGTTYSGYFRDN